jgi:hypothetical protein
VTVGGRLAEPGDLGRMIPEMTCRSVDFPDPLWPVSATCSRSSSTKRSTSSTATVSPPGMANDFRTCSSSTTGVGMGWIVAAAAIAASA